MGVGLINYNRKKEKCKMLRKKMIIRTENGFYIYRKYFKNIQVSGKTKWK